MSFTFIDGRRLAPIHPGEVLLKEFIEPKGLTRYRNAGSTRFARGTALSAGTALRLARFFGIEAQFWMSFQARYDL